MKTRTYISKVGQRRQVVIPKDVFDKLGWQEGDYLEIRDTSESVVLKPKKLVDHEDILTPREERLIKKGFAQLKRGEYKLWTEVKRELGM